MDPTIITGLAGLIGALIGGAISLLTAVYAQKKIDEREREKRNELRKKEAQNWFIETYIHEGLDPLIAWLDATGEILYEDRRRLLCAEQLESYEKAGLVQQVPIEAAHNVDALMLGQGGIHQAVTVLAVARHKESVRHQLKEIDALLAANEISMRLLNVRAVILDADISSKKDANELFHNRYELQKYAEEIFIYSLQLSDGIPFSKAKGIFDDMQEPFEKYTEERRQEIEDYVKRREAEEQPES